MEILIIGGTQFVGRAMAEVAIERGHEVTLFHRGQTNPGLFTGRATEILGDRKGDLSAISGREWDAVIDCVGYTPDVVGATVDAVTTKHYAFVSTISVYPSTAIDETSETLVLPEGMPHEPITGENYGPLKVLCENEVLRRFPNSTMIRAGLQIGEHDHTDRFSDWIDRLIQRDRVVVPDDQMRWQMIDARDTARFTLHCLETQTYGAFNVTGEPVYLADVITAARDAVAPDVELVSVSPETVLAHARAWEEVTLWLPEGQRDGFPLWISIDRAKAAGLTLRPLADTVREIAAAIRTKDPMRARRGGLLAEKEDAILAALG